jgi:hypothetical protein
MIVRFFDSSCVCLLACFLIVFLFNSSPVL